MCDKPRRCTHTVELPEWWVGLVTARADYHPASVDPLFTETNRRINRYRGAGYSDAVVLYTQAAARDCLWKATLPLPAAWPNFTLSTIGALADWCETTGLPLERNVVFHRRTINRFLSTAPITKRSQASYRSRLDTIAVALLAAPVYRGGYDRPTLGKPETYVPFSLEHETDLWAWVCGIQPAPRRRLLQAGFLLAVGCGARVTDFNNLYRRDLAATELGVEVTFPPFYMTGHADRPRPARTVTCRARWESELADLFNDVDPDDLLLSVGTSRTTRLDDAFHAAKKNSVAKTPPPFDFTLARLRTTWIGRHLEAGTPLQLLLPAAGLTGFERLERIYPLITPVDHATDLLRGTGGGPL